MVDDAATFNCDVVSANEECFTVVTFDDDGFVNDGIVFVAAVDETFDDEAVDDGVFDDVDEEAVDDESLVDGTVDDKVAATTVICFVDDMGRTETCTSVDGEDAVDNHLWLER